MNRFLLFIITCLSFSFYAKGQKIKDLYPAIGSDCMINQSEVDSIRTYYEKNYPQGDINGILEEEIYYTQVGDGWYNCAYPSKIQSSSFLKPSKETDYKAENAHDFDKRTAWVEGVSGYGIGEYLEYEFVGGNYETPITKVILINGYVKSESAWQNNSRVKKLKMYLNGIPYAILNLQDNSNFQTFSIGEITPKKNEAVLLKFEIIDVYKGAKFDDTAIGELEFDGLGCLCVSEGSKVIKNEQKVNIETLNVNDSILAFDGKKILYAKVTKIHKVKHNSLIKLIFSDNALLLTQDHPIFVKGKGWCSFKPEITKTFTDHNEINRYDKNDFLLFFNGSDTSFVQLTDYVIDPKEYTTYTIEFENPDYSYFVNDILVGIENKK